MLLSEFVDILSKDFPQLYSTLHVGDLVRFAGLAARSPHQLWRAIAPMLSQFHVQPGPLIQQHGYRSDLDVKIPEFTLFTPVKDCLLCHDPKNGRQKLHHRSQIHGYLYDLDGVHTVGIVTLKCPTECATHYRPSYYSSANKIRTYYSAQNGRNDETYQMLAHISNFNLVNIFNLSHIDYVELPELESAPKVLPSLSETTCRDTLDIHTLLLRADWRQSCLSVETSGPPNQRYHQAMQAVLEWIALEGSHHRRHVCSACLRVVPLPGEDGNPRLGYIRAVVTDGITIGHWRCTATPAQLQELAQADALPPPNGPCTSPLVSVKDRFCPHHQKRLGSRCQAQPCRNNAQPGHHTCELQEHIQAYYKFKARVTSNFTLTSMLNRPSDPTVHQDWETAELTG
ncbi:uncharacterized protein MELLADRAFT_93341 [Melampsora larici-populina 98AG31]|uniref:CxC5 like cysteine cluster associated with KDZ domain-containing protein n=1 Tax=Melampsora larici-populina (strain 98AG31 / pathotype 3-4-7) TaxID=747676 RepID=F4S4U3_MELLP|nr:uncharacterized protein MELLADRAFT_93341 [Melampsora larici-populina 98AG31]EGG00367.1 hypothetical protein MELLADRAFT_93341 [Melampsora larici-populina 98AG31]